MINRNDKELTEARIKSECADKMLEQAIERAKLVLKNLNTVSILEVTENSNEIIEKHAGVAVLNTSNYEDAKYKAEEFKPDVIVVDGNGNKNATELLPVLKSISNAVVPKILIISKEIDNLDSVKQYIDHIAFKPIDVHSIVRLMYKPAN